MGSFDDALLSIGQSVAQSASGYVREVTGPAVGNILGTLFGGGQLTGGSDIAKLDAKVDAAFADDPADLKILNMQMSDRATQLTEMGTELDAVHASLTTLIADVNAMAKTLDGLAAKQAYTLWSQQDQPVHGAVDSILAAQGQYAGIAADYVKADPEEVKNFVDTVLNATQGLDDDMLTINSYVLSDGQSKGVLQLWSEMVAPLVATAQMDYRYAVQQYTAYYTKLASAQLFAANLLVEAHNYYGHGAEKTWSTYQGYVVDQEDQFIQWLVPLVYSGVTARWSPTVDYRPCGPLYTAVDAAMQLHPGVQAMPGDSAGGGYYSPSAVFADAEAMLASLVLTDPENRRIVTHMVFSDDKQGTLKHPIDGISISLQAVAGENSAAQADTVLPMMTSKFSYWFPDWAPGAPSSIDLNIFGPKFWLYRQVFATSSTGEALRDGSYQLTNFNDVLPPIRNYLSNAVFFQETKVLDYTLHVAPTSQFDFMNFGAYMISTGTAHVGVGEPNR